MNRMDITTEADASIHRRRGLMAAILTLVVLALLSLFVWRVIHYAKLIKSGGVDPSLLSFTSAYTVSATLAAEPIEEGIFDLSTVDDPSLGSSSAVITIVEFADFQCPYSRESSFVVRELAAKYPQVVRFIYRDFPLSEIHPLAQMAAQAGECAQDQGKFWEYHDKLYQHQDTLTRERFVEFAEELNMNVYQFESCLNSGRYTDEVTQDYEEGAQAGVRGTPTFFINGNRVPGSIPQEIFEAVIQSILDQENT